jgi:hypothetical protein
MFHHVVLLRWVEGTELARIEEFTAALRALPAVIAEIKSYSCGSGVNVGNWDFGISASFDDPDGWATYDGHRVHNEARAIVAGCIADRSAAQFWD